MTQRHLQHATPAHAAPGKPTTPPAAVVASANDHDGTLVSDEDIRLCASQRWEAAGKPNGHGVRFWLEAEQELSQRKNEKPRQRRGSHGQHEHERPEAEKTVKERHVNVDSRYKDNNRMFQGHGERGHRHGGSG